MSSYLDKSQILNKIKTHYGFKSNLEFSSFLGIAATTLSSWYSRNSIDFELIFAKCVDIDANWLLSGKGNMLKERYEVTTYKLRTDDNRVCEEEVPVYNILAVAGVVSLFKDLQAQTPIDYIHIPNLPKCDGAVYITGDSMYPLLKSGDIIAYKEVSDLSYLLWGEMYLLSIVLDGGDSYVTVKYVQKGEQKDHVKLVSQNQHHQDRELPRDSIKFAALVKASIRINSMG